MAQVGFRLGLLSTCYLGENNWYIVYPREGNLLYNDDIIQLIDYLVLPYAPTDLEIWWEIAEVTTGYSTEFKRAKFPGTSPASSQTCWFAGSSPCCSKGASAWNIAVNGIYDLRVCNNQYGPCSTTQRFTFGDPSKRAQIDALNAYWINNTTLKIEASGTNLVPITTDQYWYCVYIRRRDTNEILAAIALEPEKFNPNSITLAASRLPADGELVAEMKLCSGSAVSDYRNLTITPYVCTEGSVQCTGWAGDLLQCVNNEWTIIESNSPTCGYVPDCVCSAWTDAGCISDTTRRLVRACTPAGCASEEATVSDPSCSEPEPEPNLLVPLVIAGAVAAVAGGILWSRRAR